MQVGGLLAQESEATVEREGGEVGDKAALEARAEPRGEAAEGVRRLVAGEDELLTGLVQVVEGVEELLLGALLAGEELDIVDKEGIESCGTCRRKASI